MSLWVEISVPLDATGQFRDDRQNDTGHSHALNAAIGGCLQFVILFSCSVILADVATVFLATCNNTRHEDADVYSG